MSMRIPTRVFFEKTGRLKYLAHLDTMRAFMRAITRSGLLVWYTEGYNPQVYLSFALPLSLGYEGLEESFDIYLLEDREPEDIVLLLNEFLPDALRVREVAEPVEKATEIAWADYRLEFYTNAPLDETIASLEEYLALPEMFVEKRSKRGMRNVDIKAYVKNGVIQRGEDSVVVTFRTAAGNFYNINPRLFTQGFAKFCGIEPNHVAYTRMAVLDGDEKPFR